jgi:hypothetical protein
MQPSMAAAALWAFFLLCVTLLSSGAWRMAVPISSIEVPAARIGPAAPDDEDEQLPETDRAPRRLRAPAGLMAAVAATALVRVGVLVALGR